MELLAQTVEALSILTTKKFATKEPRKVDRPGWVTGEGSPQAVEQGGHNPFARAIDRVLSLGAPRRAAGGAGS